MKLNFKQYIALASMLFGLFFGAGNLIFPALMGQMAGSASPAAMAGFIATGVGLPLLGIVAFGLSRSSGLMEMASRVSRGYGLFFTCALYLTIGPLFAIPRTATVSFSVGIEALIPGSSQIWLLVFSLAFFAAVLFFSLRPGKILTTVGRVINPLFLASLGVLLVTAMLNPLADISTIAPSGAYESQSFLTGFLEGYNTVDALASLAFGIIVVNVIKDLGVTDPKSIAMDTIKAGIFSSIIMAVIYVGITVVGAQSRGVYDIAPNGGIALSLIAQHYFGSFGGILLAVTITLACLKTAIGLVTSCSQMFTELFPKSMSYKYWAILFSLVSFAIANFGLNAITTWSLPVLMFLYPLAIILILLNICGGLFNYSPIVFGWTTWFTFAAAILDLIRSLPGFATEALGLNGFIAAVGNFLPFFNIGMGWVIPSLVGFAIGFVLYRKNK